MKRENEVGQRYAVAAVKGEPSSAINDAVDEGSTNFVNKVFGMLK